MIKKIFKYEIPIQDWVTLRLPVEGQILHIGLDGGGTPCLWWEFDLEQKDTGILELRLIPTGVGFDFQDLELLFRQTIVLPSGLVFHIYEVM